MYQIIHPARTTIFEWVVVTSIDDRKHQDIIDQVLIPLHVAFQFSEISVQMCGIVFENTSVFQGRVLHMVHLCVPYMQRIILCW